MAESPAPCWSNIVKSQPSKTQNNNSNNNQTAAANLLFDTSKASKGIAVAVVDANAIIQGGEKLTNVANKFVSVSEVISEVRDPVSRQRLNFFPFTVDTVEPSPESLRKVINFARATGDLQTLSDVDIKLIALTYTLEGQIHGTEHLRDFPPSVHVVHVNRLPEKDLPGWGSNVPNLEEWEALEHEAEDGAEQTSRILPLKDLNLNTMCTDYPVTVGDDAVGNGTNIHPEEQEEADSSFQKPRKYFPKKKGINIEGKKMVANGVDASQGESHDNPSDWLPAVSRSTHRRFLRRKARREMSEISSVKNVEHGVEENLESDVPQNDKCSDQPMLEVSDEANHVNGILKEQVDEGTEGDEDIASLLTDMRLEEESLYVHQQENDPSISYDGSDRENSLAVEAMPENNAYVGNEGNEVEKVNDGVNDLEISSLTNESVDAPFVDDNSSEQSWMLRSLSDSSVACVTGDFAMQNVLLQMGLRLLAPGGMQIRQLHRWVLRCHACYEVTTEIGRIFCPKCGNGGTLRKVAVTVGENGIVLANRRPRVTLRGTKFSLPLPLSGRDAITKNPILREDQLPHKLLYPKTRNRTNKEGDDIFYSDDIFHHSSKRAPHKPPVGRAVAAFIGRRNPNDNHHSRSKH